MSSKLARFGFRLSIICCFLAIVAFTASAQTLTFTTLAGSEGGSGSADGTGGTARFNLPFGVSDSGGNLVATDSGGNVYVADKSNHTIRKITPAGVVTTLAGLAGIQGSANGTGGAARFNGPAGVATDSGGNVYVADLGNSTIRKITPARVVTTLAGLAGQNGSADGSGSAARFNFPAGVATDSGGNVYVADASNHTIRKITPAGVVTTLAGSAGLSGSTDGTGSAARFNNPLGVATDSGGNVYVAEGGFPSLGMTNHTIRKITPAGEVTTLAGLAGQNGSADGSGSTARFNGPSGVATDGAGNVYVADTHNNAIRKITPAGVVTTLAGSAPFSGSADGTGSAARFSSPKGVAIDSGGNVYVADAGNHTLRKITPAGVVTTLAGSVSVSGSADGTGSGARFSAPGGVATDNFGGTVYVADGANSIIRKINTAGTVTTLAGSAGLSGSADGTGSAARFGTPFGVATDAGGNVYVGDRGNSTIRKITPAGVVTTLAGSAGPGSFDGPGSVARFDAPTGVATDSDGNVYVADQGNTTIRKITSTGEVTTLAGSAGLVGSADGTGSAARFNFPLGVATDSGGNVYVADTFNFTIRKITPVGVVTTLAGSAGLQGSADGTGSAARFNRPSGVAADSGGNVYVAEESNNTIRKITPAGVVTTLAGLATAIGTADGTGSAARFNFPSGIATDSAGNIFYVADTENHRIRIGRPSLADAATIDSSTGAVGTARQLDTAPQTATSFEWTLIRQPSGSAAQLSSASIRNPLFTPDVADLFVFQLTASNGAMASITTVSLTSTPLVTCPVITVNPATLPNGAVGSPYNQTISATGAAAPFTFSVTTGALPNGLSLNATTGAITGTPTLAGTFNFTITATDTNLCPGSRAYSIVIGPPICPAITVNPATLPNGVVGSAYNQTMSATGGTAPFTFSVTAGALPGGLSLNATTGAITGTPNLEAPFNFTITATDANGCFGSRAYSITVVTIPSEVWKSFAVLGGSTVTNTGASSIRGDVGVSPGASVTGFPPGVVTGGTIHAGDAVAGQAQSDLTTRYNDVAGVSCMVNLGGQDLGGRTLTPGVYCFPGPILTGTLTLDFQGDPTADFIFQTASLFTTAANSSVLMINADGSTCPPNVFWQVGFGMSLGANSVFVGNILANGDITLQTGARLSGRALARNGAVTLDTNTVGMCPTVIIKGDADGDGATTVTDIFYLINSLFAGGPASIGAGDADGDGQITVGDIFYLINYLFAGGPPPV